MTLSGAVRGPFRARLLLVALAVLLAGSAACYNRGMRQEPRRGMDAMWCPEDSVRMAYVHNRGPGPARLMVRQWLNNRGDEADLAVLAARETGEYMVPDSVMVFVYDPDATTSVPRQHAPAIPASGVPRAKVDIEYFCR